MTDETEKDFVYSIINRRSYDYYWLGLNDLKSAGAYEWITTDGSDPPPYNWAFWSDGLDPLGHPEPNTDKSKRCTYALFSVELEIVLTRNFLTKDFFNTNLLISLTQICFIFSHEIFLKIFGNFLCINSC